MIPKLRGKQPHRPTKGQRRPRCLVADHDCLFRALIIAFLRDTKGRDLQVRTADDPKAMIQSCGKLKPDLLVLALSFLNSCSFDSIEKLRKATPDTRILVYSAGAVDPAVIYALRAGVDGFVDRVTPKTFLKAIDLLIAGEYFYGPEASRLLREIAQGKHAGATALSHRECEVLALIAKGKTTKEIADVLELSPATVGTHRRNEMSKIGAHNTAELIRFGYEHGFLPMIKSTD